MILLIHDEPLFTDLVYTVVPRLAGMPKIQEIMEEYTSGYLTKKRLKEVLLPGMMPMITIAPLVDPDRKDMFGNPMPTGAVGSTSGDLITIHDKFFEAYCDGAEGVVRHMGQTVLHELAHWGYNKAELEGLRNNKASRAHHRHGSTTSPLDDEMFQVIDMVRMLATKIQLL